MNSMPPSPPGRPPYSATHAPKRRAAFATFRPYLSEAELIEALWLLQNSYTKNDMATLIAYVNALCERFGLGNQRTTLYAEYYSNLRLAEDALPPDPWPLMVGETASRQVSPPPVAVIDASPPSEPAVTAAVEPEPLPSEPPPPSLAVFSAFATALAAGAEHRFPGSRSEFLDGFRESLAGGRLSEAALQSARAWSLAPRPDQWKEILAEDELSRLAHLLYVVLCETVGPVAADELLTEAVAMAGKLPESRYFSPRQLL